jgi:CxxC motif-containing protein
MPENRTFEYLCIECPLGCRMEVEEDQNDTIVEVRGFTCKKGKVYAPQEHTDPRRSVTTTISVSGGIWPRLPVKTDGNVPKGRVGDVCRALRSITISAPVHMGDVVAADILGTGIDVVATRDLPSD